MDITIRTESVAEHAVVVNLYIAASDEPDVLRRIDELSLQIKAF